jgi:hypothetical protein
MYLMTGLAGIVALQTLWLLPALDARALVYISGSTPPPSHLHLVYIVVEALKLMGLFVLGVWQVNFFRNAILQQKEAWPA